MDKNLTNSLVIDGISVHDRVNINRLFAKLLCINDTYIENIETSDVYTDQNGSLITAGKLQDTIDEIIKNSSTIFVLKAIDKLTETSTTNGLYLCTYSFTKDTTVKSPMTYKQYVYNDTKIDDDVDNGDEITGNVNYTYKVNHLYLIEDNTTTEILLPTENLEIINIFLKLESNNSLFLYEYNNDVNWMSIGVKQILQSNNSVVLTPSKEDINISSNNAVICNDTIKGSSVGNYSLVSGYENECTGNSSFVSGSNNSNSSSNSLVSGVGLINNNENGTVIGKYNDTTNNNLLFCVGCGTNDNDRKNALVVDNDGLVNVNSISSSSIVVDSNDNMITIDKGVINVGNNLTIDGVNNTINVGEIEADKITANEFNLKNFSLTNINSENITNKNLVKTSQLQITNSDQTENPIIERIIDTHDEYENLTNKSNVLMNCNCIDEVKPGLIKYNNDNGTGEIFNSYNLEGGNKASGNYSHAEGYNTSASGDYSHASGIGTVANQNSQTVVGKYNNTDDTNANNSLFVVGNGTEETRNNAFIVKNNGDAIIQNNLTSASITNKTTINSNGINTNSLIISKDSTQQTTINDNGITIGNETTKTTITNDKLTVSSITLNNQNIIGTTSSTEVEDTIIATQKYVDDTKTTIENNINTLQGKVDTNTGKITTLETTVGNNTSDITTLKSTVETNTSDISDLTTKVNNNTSDISELKNKVETNTTSITTLDGKITTLEGTVGNHTTSITALETTVGNHNTSITTLRDDVDANTNSIAALETTVGTNSSDITELKTTVGNHSTSISALESMKTTVESHTNSISALETTVGTNTSDITALKNTDKTHTSDIANLKTTVESYTNSITALRNDVDTNTNDISALKNTDETHTSDIANLKTTVGTLQGTVGTLEGKVNELNELKKIITTNSIKLTTELYTVNITLNNNGTLSINGKNNNNNTPYSLNVDVSGEVNVMPV